MLLTIQNNLKYPIHSEKFKKTTFSGNNAAETNSLNNCSTNSLKLINTTHNMAFIKKNKANVSFHGYIHLWPNTVLNRPEALAFIDSQSNEPMLTMSSYFRRGFYSGASDDFQDVIDVLADILKEKKRPIRILVAGVADGQEPISLLASVSELTQHSPIEETLDLNLVDINPYPKIREISNRPIYAESSFEKLAEGTQPERWQLKTGLRDYICRIYKNCVRPNDPKNPEAKSFWNTEIETFSKLYPSKKYDIISFNNVRQYMSNKSVGKVLSDLAKMLEYGGIFITDPDDSKDKLGYFSGRIYNLVPEHDEFIKLKPGIWKKVRI